MYDKRINVHSKTLSERHESADKMNKSENEKNTNDNDNSGLNIAGEPREKDLVIPKSENAFPNILKESKDLGK